MNKPKEKNKKPRTIIDDVLKLAGKTGEDQVWFTRPEAERLIQIVLEKANDIQAHLDKVEKTK